MKNLIATLMWTVIVISSTNAQEILSDTISLYEQGEKVGQVIAANIHEQTRSNDWELLIQEFQKQLEIIQDQIPEYDSYNINFVKNYNMTIEENEETKEVHKYDVKNGMPPKKSSNQSVVTLHQEKLKIKLLFTNINDLSDPKIMMMIKDALSKLVMQKNALNYLPIKLNNLNYNFSDGTLTKKNKKKLGKLKLIAAGIPSVGFYKNKPIFSMNTGFGLTFGDPEKHVLYFMFNELFQFQEGEQRGRNVSLFGVSYAPSKFISISYLRHDPPSADNTTFSDLRSRLSVTLNAGRGAFSLHMYNPSTEQSSIGVDVGIPIGVRFDRFDRLPF